MTHALAAISVEDLINFKEKTTQARQAVVQLEHNDSVGDALKTLAKHHILSAPLVLSPSLEDLPGEELATPVPTLLGWVDVQDILHALLADVRKNNGGSIPQNMLLLMSSLENAGKAFSARTLVTLQSNDDKSLVYETEAAAGLLPTIRDSFLGQGSRVVHRLAVFNSLGEVQHIISQMDVVKLLASQPDLLLGDMANKTLEQLGLLPAGPHVVCVDPNQPTLIALDRMASAGVSGAAVCTGAGALIANLSASDLRGIQPEHLGVLALPVAEFLALLHGTSYLGYSQRSSQQVDHPFFASRPAKAPPSDAAEAGDDVRLITCAKSATLRDVLTQMATNHVHRIYVTDPDAKPQVVAVLTPTNILQYLTSLTTPT